MAVGKRTIWILNYLNKWEAHDGGPTYRDALGLARKAIGDRENIPVVVIVYKVGDVTVVERSETYPRPGAFVR